jgi:predicted AAA+ superfamily ATPase
MFDREIERKVTDFRELGFPEYINRSGTVHLIPQVVSAILGARRSGKSYRAIQAANESLKAGFINSINQVCAVDFDNSILASMKASDLPLIQTVFLKLNPTFNLKTPLVFLLDEIHKIPGWENYAVELSRNINWRVIISGSSSKMIHSDTASELRGKSITSVVYPLSFSEFLRFNNAPVKTGSTAENALCMRLFDEYLKSGSYPAIPSTPAVSREALLRQYFDTMILRDIIQRNNITDPMACSFVMQAGVSGIARPYTVKSLTAAARASGHTVGRETVAEYVKWAEDAWLFFTVTIYSSSIKEQARNYKKLYCIDWALAHHNSSSWDGSISRSLENAVYIHLRRRYQRVNFCLTREKRQEIDFIALDSNGKADCAIQVCLDISDPETLRRETEPLVSAGNYYGIKNLIIVTYNQEKQIPGNNGAVIHAIPAWRWMLETETV